jgi:integrase
VGRYKDSAAYSALAMSSRVQRDNVLKRIITTAGHQPYRAITRAHVIKGIDDRKDRPAAARHFVEAIRGVYRWALDAGLVSEDPTRDIRVKAKRTDGHHTWTAEEMARFEACHPIGTRARVAYAVLLYAGLRRGDAVRYGRQHVKDGIGRIVTEKNGRIAIIYHTPELDDALAAGPVGDLTFIAGERGGNMTKESFGTLFKRWCIEAGVPGTAHGLRKARAVKAAEMGLSENEMLPAFGWIQPRTAAIYTRKADQERLAESGARKMLANKVIK